MSARPGRSGVIQALVVAVVGLLWMHAALARPVGSSTACENALVVREWRPYLALAGDVPPARAVSDLRRIIAWQRASIVGSQPDVASHTIEKKLWHALRDFDLRKLYHTLPNATRPPWRALNLRFHVVGNRYLSARAPARSIGDTLSTLGAARFRLAMRPKKTPSKASGGDRYELQSQWRNNIGPMRWGNLQRAFWLRLDALVESAAVAAPLAIQTKAVTRNPRLARDQQPILAQLWTAFPATADWFTGFGSVDSLRTAEASGGNRQHMHLVLSLDNARLKTHYPAVAAYLAQLGNVINTHTVIRNAQGRWLTIDLNSAKRRMTIDGWVADGHLVPSRDGQPVFKNGKRAPLASNRFETVTNMQTRSFGIHVAVRNQLVHWRYNHDAKGGHFVGWLRDKPSVSVTGRAFGLVPVGVFAAISPISMQDIMDKLMNTVVASNGGRGALAKIDISDRKTPDNVLSTDTDFDIIDNFFVHFGVRLANKRLLPDSKALAGLRRMGADGMDAFRQDLNRRATIKSTAACAAMNP